VNRVKLPFLIAVVAILALSSFLVLNLTHRHPPVHATTKNTGGADLRNVRLPSPSPVEKYAPSEAQDKQSQTSAPGESSKRSYSLLIVRHRSARKRLAGVHEDNRSGFAWDTAYGYTQARLLALCYPSEVETLALETVKDNQATLDDLIFSAKILGILAAQGRKAAEVGLVGLLESTKNGEIIATALDSLMSYDKEGRHRGIYWSKCSQGQLDAFEYGPYWVDRQTKQVLMEIKEKRDSPNAPHYYVREALARMDILDSPDRAAKMDSFIADSWDPKERPENALLRQNWALRVCQFSPTDRTLELLRHRLDRDEGIALGVPVRPNGQPAPSTNPGYAQAAGDDHFDQVLLTYLALGGRPNETESARLRHYGYLGDPKERLEALLKD